MMKIIRIAFIGLFLFYFKFTYSQYWLNWQINLIHNAGFEDGDGSPQCFGDDFDKIHVWESRFNFCDCGKASDPITGNYCYKKHYHSPDLFEYPQLTGHGSSPFQGTHYIGMSEFELVQQQFFNNNKLEEGMPYIFSMYIYNHSHSLYGATTFPSSSEIKVYLAKNKIQYKQENCNVIYNDCSGFYSNFCTSDYISHKTGWTQDIVEIASFDLANYNQDEWIFLQETLTQAPDDAYDWLAIEVRTKNGIVDCGNSYIGIDWVMLIPGCINGCSSTAGAEYITINQLHTNDNPFTIFGLKNKTDLHLKIYGIPGNEVVTEYNIPNPQNIISWNGKHYLYGTELAPAYYYYEATITNDCGTKIYDGLISKTNHTYDPTNDVGPNFNYNPVSKPPLPECCQEYIVLHNQYLVQDKTIGAPDPLLYKADIGISAGPKVIIEENNTVIFEAGQAIDLLPGFTVEQGASFTAAITPCEGLSNKSMMSENNFSYSFENNSEFWSIKESDSHKIENFQIHPNPFSDSFTISFSQPEQTDAKIFLTDAYGRQVLGIFNGSIDQGQHSIDVSTDGITKGMYFCIMETPSGRKVVKVVKNE